MKRLKIFILFIFMLEIIIYNSGVNAEINKRSYDYFTDVLNGSTNITPINITNYNKKNVPEFDNNYILVCRYDNDSSSARMYYSLKNNYKNFYIIRTTEIWSSREAMAYTFVNTAYSLTESLSSNRLLKEPGIYGVVPTRWKVEGAKLEYKKEQILDDLSNGKCPTKYSATAYISNIFTGKKSFVDCIGDSCPITNKGEPTVFNSSKNYIKDGIENASLEIQNNVTNFRTEVVNDDGTITFLKADNILGNWYENFKSNYSESCKYNGEINYDTCVSDLLNSNNNNIFINSIKKSIISSNNSTDVTSLELPKFIINSTILNNQSNKMCAFIDSLANNDCAKNNKSKMEYNETEETIDNNIESEKNVNNNNNNISKYVNAIIKGEQDKPSGCAIFGDNTTKIIKWAYKLLKIGAPLLVVVFGILDFVKSLLNGEDKGFKEAWQRFIKRLIAAIVVILLPVLLTFILNLSGVLKQYGIDTSDDIYCIFK